ncbi:GntR family transcriptional regulator [Microbacterium sp.]|uniref:GntR family transcriptional regulator n=1 Tax=Microbacterium sp. TaxID=51671 RepID=UPI002CE98CFA|nr:GntR family transcriptional regulator [Microbacterium sp.]HWL78020.1 GntR family transcriptional regulator [Microbacterium sp.]
MTSVAARPQLGDEVASYVRDQITSGTLAPGAHVRPEAVAAELGISSTPAREALQALRAEGFLELAPRRGFTVARISGSDIRDMFLMQSMVGGELAARAARNATPALGERLREIHAELIAAAERGDLNALEEWNHRFHREINLAAGAPRLAWVIQLLSRYAPRRFYASIEGWPETTIDDHSGLLEAVIAGDADRARAEMVAHIEHAGEQLAAHVDARLQSHATQFA